MQRYIAQFPAAGEVVIFDRSWYNRAGVEPVLGYCTPEQTERFLEMVPGVEKAMVDSGIILVKYWLNVSVEEQARRLESRIDDPRKVWKLSPTDLKSFGRRYEYCRHRDTMLRGDRHRVGAMVHRRQRRQEARPTEHHLPPPRPDPVRTDPTPRRQAAQATATTRVRRARSAAASRPREVLRVPAVRRDCTGGHDRAESHRLLILAFVGSTLFNRWHRPAEPGSGAVDPYGRRRLNRRRHGFDTPVLATASRLAPISIDWHSIFR